MRTALVLSLLLAACASTPVPTHEAQAVAVLAPTLATPRQGTGQLVVRTDKFSYILIDRTAPIFVWVGDVKVAEFSGREPEKVTVYLDPGDYPLRARFSPSMLGDAEAWSTLRAGEVQVFRFSFVPGESPRLTRVQP